MSPFSGDVECGMRGNKRGRPVVEETERSRKIRAISLSWHAAMNHNAIIGNWHLDISVTDDGVQIPVSIIFSQYFFQCITFQTSLS